MRYLSKSKNIKVSVNKRNQDVPKIKHSQNVTPKEPCPQSLQPSTSGVPVKNRSAFFSEGFSKSDTDDDSPSEKCCLCQTVEPQQL